MILRMKKKKRIVFLCICACIVIFCQDAFKAEPVLAAETNASIQEKEQEIEQARKEVSSLKSSLTDVEALKKELEKSKSDLTTYVTQLDSELSSIQDKIDKYNTLITEKEMNMIQDKRNQEKNK